MELREDSPDYLEFLRLAGDREGDCREALRVLETTRNKQEALDSAAREIEGVSAEALGALVHCLPRGERMVWNRLKDLVPGGLDTITDVNRMSA